MKKAFNKLSLYKSFSSQIKLSQDNNVIKTIDLGKAKLNWSLAKLYITPQQGNEIHVNSLSSNSSNDSTAPVVKSVKELGLVKFNNYLRKIGMIISSEKNIYVQTGVFESTSLRVVSGEKESAQILSSLFEKNEEYNESGDYRDIVVMTQGELKVKPFIIQDNDRKVIVTNSLNTNELKSALKNLI